MHVSCFNSKLHFAGTGMKPHTFLTKLEWTSGFSQGAALASLLLAQYQKQDKGTKIKFAMLVRTPMLVMDLGRTPNASF